MDAKGRNGFTIIELVVVVLILAILTAYASTRSSGRDEFAARALQQQVISVVRQVQINRMQSNISAATVTLDVTANCVGSQTACTARSNVRSDWVTDNSNSMIFAPIPSGAAPVLFDQLGNPIDAASAGVTITITPSQQPCTVTINSQGYVSGQGGC